MIEDKKNVLKVKKIVYFVKIFLILLFFIVYLTNYQKSFKSKQKIIDKIIYKPKIFNKINSSKNLSFSSLNISDLTFNNNLTKSNHKNMTFAIIRK